MFSKDQRVVLGKAHYVQRVGAQGTAIYVSEVRKTPFMYTIWWEGARDPTVNVSEKHIAALPDHVQDSRRR